ncbi:hypothetical protein MJO28_015779 [Puccinia striiformis f. sp. tritici]|uniref:Uncharacterized protein n=1 Tax=Puccinia striiformis f. sp. tritici TaxID=168172 RepID=A0ACC0DPM7_9BASI|nr:hypothetical protein MJO28_015779 [Puccinia striiformis f. sp. tritici]
MVEFSVDLGEKNKLTGANYLDWKSKISSILQLKHLLRLVLKKEATDKAALADKLDQNRYDDALAILKINCDTKIADHIDLEAEGSPSEFWRLLEEHYQPKSIQNQAMYLNQIFTTVLNSNDLETTLATLSYNNQQLCALIDDTKIKPSTLLETVIAMWCIINLPSEYKNSGELLLKKCQIEKKSPSIKEVVEEIRWFMQRNSEAAKTSKALATSRRAPNPGYVYNGPKSSVFIPPYSPASSSCLLYSHVTACHYAINHLSEIFYHNPKTVHKAEECSQLKLKPTKEEKPVKALLASLQQNNSVYILDLGATTSMFISASAFPAYNGIDDYVYLAHGDKARAIGQGTVSIEFPHAILQLRNSLLVPTLTSNLISLSAFIKNNYTLKSGGGNKFILADELGAPVITGSLADGNFLIHQVQHLARKVDIKSQSTYEKHQAAGHPSPAYFYKMFPNIPKVDFTCNTCDVSKAHKEPFLGNFPAPTRPLEYQQWASTLTVFDVNRTLRDLFLKIKNESASHSIVNLVSDNGTEFKNKDLIGLYTSKGINPLTTAPYTPEENPFTERGNQTTVAKLCCLLNDSNLPLCFWAKAAQTTVYLENITPLSEGKLGNRGARGTFLGYGEGHRSYRILDAETGNVKITHHVKFNNHVFPSYPSNESNQNDSPLTFLFDEKNQPSEPPSPGSSPKPTNPTPPGSDSSDDDQRFEEFLVDPSASQEQQPSPSDSPIDETPAPTKNYSWASADQPAPNNISSDTDAANITGGSCQFGHSGNALVT